MTQGQVAPARPEPPERRWPAVTVIIVNLDGREYLADCLGSIRAQDYPAEQVEVVFIDNNSSDGSVEYVGQEFPEVRVVVNDHNTGFAPAVNQAARLANGAYLALLNNDAEAGPGWLREAVRTLEGDDVRACVASKILRPDGSVDYAGGQMAFYGHGFARGVGQADTGEAAERATLFASGAAMVTRTEVFLENGGFDESYFAFFEDVDYGWRLWVLGYQVVYVPSSVVTHRHHGTIERFGYPRERYLLERNALATIFKNYGDDMLARTLPASLVLSLGRALLEEDLDVPDYAITDSLEPVADLTLSAQAGAHFAAIRDWALQLDELKIKRARIQHLRGNPDSVVLRLFEQSLEPNVLRPEFRDAFDSVLKAFDLSLHAEPRTRVLIITEDYLGERMAGPAIRCWEMAKLLSGEHEVTLGSTQPAELDHADFRVLSVNSSTVDQLLPETDVVIFQGFILHIYPQIADSAVPVLVDCYDPFHLEGLELRKDEPAGERYATASSDTDVLNKQFERADFMVCASEKQRDFWLGQLASIGRVNPATYDQDESLRSLLAVAPFGLPSEPPQKTEPVIRGVVDGIDEDDFVLLWGGGIYNWFDPLSLVRAVGEAAAEHPDVKLFFLGSAHPNPGVPRMRMAANAYHLADELGLLGSQVFFNEGWVAYERRADYLLEADVGVSTHFEHVETAYSFRTRILDYLWASLPVLATSGDSLSRLVVDHGLGLTVPPEDPAAIAEAIVRLRTDAELYASAKAGVEALAPSMTWDRALAPIAEFCRAPRRAPDRVGTPASYVAADGTGLVTRPAEYYAKRLAQELRTRGPRVAATHVYNFARQRLGR
jgi:GT2 family glycosyltransferase